MAIDDNRNGFAEQLMQLLDAVAEETQRRAPTTDDAISVEMLLAEDGEVRRRFVELANQVRDVTGIDLALIEWKARAGDDPAFMIHDGGQSASEWPLWRRVA